MDESNTNILDQIVAIWKDCGIDVYSDKESIIESDFEAAYKSAKLKPLFLNYGEYCGPGTKVDRKNVRPKDALDLVCKFHDTYYANIRSDEALSRSTKLLMERSDIGIRVTGYGRNIAGPMFIPASNLWRFKEVTIILSFLLVVLSGSMFFIIGKHKQKMAKLNKI